LKGRNSCLLTDESFIFPLTDSLDEWKLFFGFKMKYTQKLLIELNHLNVK